jgi:hypothetical protein
VREARKIIGLGLPYTKAERVAYAAKNIVSQGQLSELKSRIHYIASLKEKALLRRKIEMLDSGDYDDYRNSEKVDRIAVTDPQYADIEHSILRLRVLHSQIDELQWILRSTLTQLGEITL